MPWLTEKLRKELHQPWFGGGVGALLAATLGVLLLLFPVGKGVRDWSYDLPFAVRPEKSIDDVVIVRLDEESCRVLNQSPAGFDRSLHARLVTRLKNEGAKVIVFDILFIDSRPSASDADRAFAKAIQEHGQVVLCAQYQADAVPPVFPPVEALTNAAAGWGLALVHRDDFGPRQHHPGTQDVPSLAWTAAELLGAEVTRFPRSRAEERWLNYYSPKPFRGISYCEALLSNTLPSGFSFSNKVVFVGQWELAPHIGETKDEHRYPWTWLTQVSSPGVAVHAVTFSNLIRQDWLRRCPTAIELSIMLATGWLLGYGLSLFRPLAATGFAILAALTTTGAAFFLSVKVNVWFPWMIIVTAQVPLALGWSYLFHSIKSYVEKKLLETSLALYLSPHQVKQILKRPDLLRPGAEQKNVSILFSDITNFSKISERMDPNDLVKLLNNYYEAAIACVHATDGTVMNLIGDAIFAIWNAPQEQPDHQERACRTALLLNEQLVSFDAASTNLPLRTRIGLHTGDVCVGNIGSSTHFDFTAIGENVNMASRLEGLNRQLGTNILATRNIQKFLEGRIVSRLVGHFKFKGFDQVSTEIYELIGTAKEEATSREWRKIFAEALWNFERKAFVDAERGFRQTLELRPDDGPSKFYLERVKEFQTRPPPADWIGEVDLREK